MPRTAAPPSPAVPASTVRAVKPKTPAERQAMRRTEARKAMAALNSAVLGRQTEALTAAAKIISIEAGNNITAGLPNSLTRVWQHAAIAYSKTTPELGAAKMYVGNCLSRCTVKAGKRNPDGTVHSAFDGAEPADGIDAEMAGWVAEVIQTLRSEVGGQSELLRRYGEQMFMTGECYFVLRDTPAGMVTDCRSVLEITVDGEWAKGEPRFKQIVGDGGGSKILPRGTQVIRVWRPDIAFSSLATSSVQGCITILDELDVLTRLVKASAVSRMSLSGLVVIPEEMDSPLDDAAPDNSEEMYPLISSLIQAAVTAIDDPSAAAAFAPYFMQGPADLLDKVRHIPFMGEGQEHVLQRAEAQMRLAQGLDLPVEVVKGAMQTTFANQAVISEDTFRLHIRPSLEMLVDFLTKDILWPALADKMGLTPAQVLSAGYGDRITSVAITYDASELVSHPDKLAEMIQIIRFDKSQMILRIAEIREALGLDPDQVPDDAEVQKRLDALRLAGIKETIAAPASDAAVPLEEANKAVIPGESAGSKLIGQPPVDPVAAVSGDPAAPVTSVTASTGFSVLSYQIAAMGEMAIEHAAERVGSRVRDKARGEVAERIVGMQPGEIPGFLGPDTVAQVIGQFDPAGLEVASFARSVARLAVKSGHPYPGVVAEGTARIVAARAKDRIYGVDSTLTADVVAPLLEMV
jgi:hypothetical protein